MYAKIQQARETQSQIATLQQQLSNLFTPTLYDTDLLPALYKQVTDRRNTKELKHSFVFIVVYLYSPSTVVGQYSIKAGLCPKIGDTIGCCRQVVSETFHEARFRYNNLQEFREQTDRLFLELNSIFQK